MGKKGEEEVLEQDVLLRKGSGGMACLKWKNELKLCLHEVVEKQPF